MSPWCETFPRVKWLRTSMLQSVHKTPGYDPIVQSHRGRKQMYWLAGGAYQRADQSPASKVVPPDPKEKSVHRCLGLATGTFREMNVTANNINTARSPIGQYFLSVQWLRTLTCRCARNLMSSHPE